MALPVSTLSNTQLYLRYPPLPLPTDPATQNVHDYAEKMQNWYADFTKLLQKDREDILAAIKKLQP